MRGPYNVAYGLRDPTQQQSRQNKHELLCIASDSILHVFTKRMSFAKNVPLCLVPLLWYVSTRASRPCPFKANTEGFRRVREQVQACGSTMAAATGSDDAERWTTTTRVSSVTSDCLRYVDVVRRHIVHVCARCVCRACECFSAITFCTLFRCILHQNGLHPAPLRSG